MGTERDKFNTRRNFKLLAKLNGNPQLCIISAIAIVSLLSTEAFVPSCTSNWKYFFLSFDKGEAVFYLFGRPEDVFPSSETIVVKVLLNDPLSFPVLDLLLFSSKAEAALLLCFEIDSSSTFWTETAFSFFLCFKLYIIDCS